MENKIIVFQDTKIKRTWFNDEWWFCVSDVVEALTDSADVKQYIKKMRSRNVELNSYWGTICTPLETIAKEGKKRKLSCSNTEGQGVQFQRSNCSILCVVHNFPYFYKMPHSHL